MSDLRKILSNLHWGTKAVNMKNKKPLFETEDKTLSMFKYVGCLALTNFYPVKLVI